MMGGGLSEFSILCYAHTKKVEVQEKAYLFSGSMQEDTSLMTCLFDWMTAQVVGTMLVVKQRTLSNDKTCWSGCVVAIPLDFSESHLPAPWTMSPFPLPPHLARIIP
mmetsp:Transcript_46374/g.140465  ORF Transcript_46374/g.140465 Transcript_46374/m.140465 type:complete len:107 (-) Transcript_46374:2392-2712(-)